MHRERPIAGEEGRSSRRAERYEELVHASNTDESGQLRVDEAEHDPRSDAVRCSDGHHVRDQTARVPVHVTQRSPKASKNVRREEEPIIIERGGVPVVATPHSHRRASPVDSDDGGDVVQPRPSVAMAANAVPGGPSERRRAMTAAQLSGDISEVSTSRS